MKCSAHRRPSLHLSLHLFTRSAATALMLFASALTPPLAGRGHDEAGGVIVGADSTVCLPQGTDAHVEE